MAKILSNEPPNAVEKVHDLTLSAWIHAALEPKEESDRRRNVVEQLLAICKQWIRFVMITAFSLPATEDYGGRIFATGSYRHNVHSSGSDIDLVLIAPDRITREHFFTSLVDSLRKRQGITDLTYAEEAVVPIISFKFDGIDIDLSFVSIRSTHVPDNLDFLDDKIHIGLDEFAVRSVNGVRDAQLLLDLVPNKNVFRSALRIVKHWAKKRCIYGAKLGFTSGIGWAILVAKVCQLYPNQNGAGLLVRFFKFCRSWFSVERPSPVYITSDLNPANIIPGLPKSWHPKNGRAEQNALFPVITPAYPYQNSCYSVSRTTLDTMIAEFSEAYELLTTMMEATATDAPKVAKEAMARLASSTTTAPIDFGVWSNLLVPYNVFLHHQYFLHVAVGCTSAKEYSSWADFVEAKIRFLWFEGQVNRGCAFECYPQVKLRVCSQRYEEPAQAEELAAALELTSVNRTSTRVGDDASPGRNRPTSVPNRVFTAHYFFGFSLSNAQRPGGAKPAPPDLNGIRKAFHTICSPKMTMHTKLPVVEVVKAKDLPSWLPTLPREEPQLTKADLPETPSGQVDVPQVAPHQPVSVPREVLVQPPRSQPPAEVKPTVTASVDADQLLGLDF